MKLVPATGDDVFQTFNVFIKGTVSRIFVEPKIGLYLGYIYPHPQHLNTKLKTCYIVNAWFGAQPFNIRMCNVSVLLLQIQSVSTYRVYIYTEKKQKNNFFKKHTLYTEYTAHYCYCRCNWWSRVANMYYFY